MQSEATLLKQKLKNYCQNRSEINKNEMLDIITKWCKNHESIISISIQPFSNLICMLCQQIIQPELRNSIYTFNCSCCTSCHTECVKQKAIKATHGFLDDISKLENAIICNKCNKQNIPKRHYEYNIFMPEEFANHIKTANQAMIKEIAEKEREQNKIIYEREKLKVLPCCNEKCKNNINIVDIITLECDHKFCKTCIKTEIEAQFQAVAELITCPICNVEILWSTVQANADLNKELQYSLKKIGLENSMTCSVCKKVFLSDRPSLENKCDECGGIE